MVTIDEAVSSSSGRVASCSLAKSVTNAAVSSLNTSSLSMKMPSSADEPVSALIVSMSRITWRVLVDPLLGVALDVELVLDHDAAREDRRTLATARGTAAAVGRAPSHTTSLARLPWLKSLPLVGDRNSRMPSAASGSTMLQMQMAAMPTASSRPKSRIIGTLAKRRARKAKMASNVTTSRAGPRLTDASWIGWADRSITTSSSIRECIWIA